MLINFARIFFRNFLLELKNRISRNIWINKPPNLKNSIRKQSKLIGSIGASNVFSYYIKNIKTLYLKVHTAGVAAIFFMALMFGIDICD